MAVHYRPILAARLGEFEALAGVGQASWAAMTPVLEVQPVERDARLACKQFLDRVREHLPVRPFAVDAGNVPPDTTLVHGGGVLAEVLTELTSANITALPVVRGAHPEDWQDATRFAQPYGMVLRLRTPELLADPTHLVPALLAALNRARVPAWAVDLVLDFVALEGLAGPGVARQVARLREAAGWRSVTIASGAFPVDLGRLAQGEVAAIRRWEVDLWRALNAGLSQRLDFADYGVAHPRPANGRGWRAPPQLRYTVQDRWLVIKGAQKRPREFPDVCRRIRAHPEFTAGLGAADQAIIAYASGWHGTGNATTWRSLSTAHHLDFVAHRLAAVGEP